MRYGHFDCFSGAAGDMILGALIDAGCPLETMQETVTRLSLRGVSLIAEKVQRHGFAATLARVQVKPGSQRAHRHPPEIRRIIDEAKLEPAVSENAKAVFQRLAEAEAHVHGTTVEKVHFHEVGAADAIVDTVCACAGLGGLGVERITCSPIPTGSGTVTCEHGVMPVPAPATAQLLRGYPVASCDEVGELTTPTGAAILTTLAAEFGPLPEMTLVSVGCGAGAREGRTRPNLLRLFVGEAHPPDAAEHDTVTILETQVDDATGQSLGYACERLLEAGALDAYTVPIIMKKGRPGVLLTVLCRPRDAGALEAVVFAETSTFGLRRYEARRTKLARRHVTVETRFGPVRVKTGGRAGKIERAWPEYDDCAAAARKAGVPLQEVQREALRVWSRKRDDP
ncbi:MAG: nickel pincer cofactor biosynthesis protein LarC [Phycisphaerae bacterium]